MSKKIFVTEVEVEAALKVAKSQEVKDVLAALFCKPENKPNLDDYKSIKTYEDACVALGCKPMNFDTLAMVELSADPNVGSIPIKMPDHIIALMKLETISRALWGRNWEPKPDASGNKWFYYPWFALFTQDEIDNLCQQTEEKAEYFGKQFKELWAEYLAFNFTVGEPIVKQ